MLLKSLILPVHSQLDASPKNPQKFFRDKLIKLIFFAYNSRARATLGLWGRAVYDCVNCVEKHSFFSTLA